MPLTDDEYLAKILAEGEWKEADNPNTGGKYYYHKKTRETAKNLKAIIDQRRRADEGGGGKAAAVAPNSSSSASSAKQSVPVARTTSSASSLSSVPQPNNKTANTNTNTNTNIASATQNVAANPTVATQQHHASLPPPPPTPTSISFPNPSFLPDKAFLQDAALRGLDPYVMIKEAREREVKEKEREEREAKEREERERKAKEEKAAGRGGGGVGAGAGGALRGAGSAVFGQQSGVFNSKPPTDAAAAKAQGTASPPLISSATQGAAGGKEGGEGKQSAAQQEEGNDTTADQTTAPPPPPAAPQWVKSVAYNGEPFYVNTATGETTGDLGLYLQIQHMLKVTEMGDPTGSGSSDAIAMPKMPQQPQQQPTDSTEPHDDVPTTVAVTTHSNTPTEKRGGGANHNDDDGFDVSMSDWITVALNGPNRDVAAARLIDALDAYRRKYGGVGGGSGGDTSDALTMPEAGRRLDYSVARGAALGGSPKRGGASLYAHGGGGGIGGHSNPPPYSLAALGSNPTNAVLREALEEANKVLRLTRDELSQHKQMLHNQNKTVEDLQNALFYGVGRAVSRGYLPPPPSSLSAGGGGVSNHNKVTDFLLQRDYNNTNATTSTAVHRVLLGQLPRNTPASSSSSAVDSTHPLLGNGNGRGTTAKRTEQQQQLELALCDANARIDALEEIILSLQQHNRTLREALNNTKVTRHIENDCGVCEVLDPWKRLMSRTMGLGSGVEGGGGGGGGLGDAAGRAIYTKNRVVGGALLGENGAPLLPDTTALYAGIPERSECNVPMGHIMMRNTQHQHHQSSYHHDANPSVKSGGALLLMSSDAHEGRYDPSRQQMPMQLNTSSALLGSSLTEVKNNALATTSRAFRSQLASGTAGAIVPHNYNHLAGVSNSGGGGSSYNRGLGTASPYRGVGGHASAALDHSSHHQSYHDPSASSALHDPHTQQHHRNHFAINPTSTPSLFALNAATQLSKSAYHQRLQQLQ